MAAAKGKRRTSSATTVKEEGKRHRVNYDLVTLNAHVRIEVKA